MKQPHITGFKATIWFISLILAIGLFRSVISHFFRFDIVKDRLEALRTEQKRYEMLQAGLKEATSAAYIEKQAREKLGLVREGDTIVLLATPPVRSNSQDAVGAYQSNWQRWWGLFF